NDVTEIGARGFQHDFERAEYLRGLHIDVRAGQLPGCRIDAGCAANANEGSDFGDVVVWADRRRRIRRSRGFDGVVHVESFQWAGGQFPEPGESRRSPYAFSTAYSWSNCGNCSGGGYLSKLCLAPVNAHS